MKQFLTIILCIVLALSVAGCGGNSEPKTPDDGSNELDPVIVDDDPIIVEITLPASLFDEIEEIDQHTYTEEQGFEKVVINEDGSVTLTMTKEKHEEMLTEMSAGIEETFADLMEMYSYIKDITHSPNYRTVIVDVEKDGYESNWLDLTPFIVGVSSIFYQIFAGEDLHCQVIIRDVVTEETISTSFFPDEE